ncbi:MAG TPA: TraB/GumN family protein [Edaphocola sp.]|nr:TraB/GumN family protein [Edaphocola sp.]
MKKKLLVPLLLGFFTIAPITAIIAKEKAKDKKEVKLNEKSLLWKVSGNGLQKPSYVFGTIHIICKDDYFWTPAMEKAYKDADKVCMEMKLDDPALQMKIAGGLMNMSGKKLNEYFTEIEYKDLEAYFEKNVSMLPVTALPMMKPVFVYTLMSTNMFTCEETKSYESELMGKANADKKEINGLESAEDQLGFLTSMNEDSVVATIKTMINIEPGKSDSINHQFVEMIKAYKNQDLSAISQSIDMQSGAYLDKDIMLVNRNKNWISAMEEMMKKDKVFFAVGAAHLVGGNGVLNLLRQAGYKVEPIK